MKRLIPDTIAARTLLVLVVGLAVSHLLSMAFYFNDRHGTVLLTSGKQLGERISSIYRLVVDASPSEREHIIELAEDTQLHVIWSPESFLDSGQDFETQRGALGDALIAHLTNNGRHSFRLVHISEGIATAWQEHLGNIATKGALGESVMVSLQLNDGSWLNFYAPVSAPVSVLSLRFALSMGVMLLAVVVLSAWVVRQMTRSFRAFANAAKRLGTDVKSPPIPETGPIEVREVKRAFNEMHRRIQHYVEDRTQMIAAIAHDLGTPVTRLRLRAEFLEDAEEQHKMYADLDDIEAMVASALSFARDDFDVQPSMTVDLRTLLQRVCDDTSDAGRDVTVTTGNEVVPYACRPAALRRALTNLIENAVKYGQRARVSLVDGTQSATIRIEDDGPGIAAHLHEEAFRPFRRLESSRNRETGGTGLGLTVARTIILAHGGQIELANRPEGGLRVAIRLPH